MPPFWPSLNIGLGMRARLTMIIGVQTPPPAKKANKRKRDARVGECGGTSTAILKRRPTQAVDRLLDVGREPQMLRAGCPIRSSPEIGRRFTDRKLSVSRDRSFSTKLPRPPRLLLAFFGRLYEPSLAGPGMRLIPVPGDPFGAGSL